jgi:hypothetical protein
MFPSGIAPSNRFDGLILEEAVFRTIKIRDKFDFIASEYYFMYELGVSLDDIEYQGVGYGNNRR